MSIRLDYASPPRRPKSRWKALFKWIGVPVLLAIFGWWIGGNLSIGHHYTSMGFFEVPPIYDASTQSRIAEQQAHLAALTSATFIAKLAARTGVPVSSIENSLSVTASSGSFIIRISYTARTPKEAFDMATATMSEYVAQVATTPPTITIAASPQMPQIPSGPPILRMVGTVCGSVCGIILCLFIPPRRRR
jgi:capsular polysaccharide biosynthesis protein